MVRYMDPPPPGVRRWFWKWWVRFMATFGFNYLEPWEQILIFITLGIATVAFWVSVYTYSPGHLAYLHRRFSYYVFEDENVDVGALVLAWMSAQARRSWDLVKKPRDGSVVGSRAEL